MKIQTLRHTLSAGWRDALTLDPAAQLAIVFGAAEYLAQSQALAELRAHVPNAQIVGCSTAGEIHHDSVEDGSLSVSVLSFDATPFRVVTARVTSAAESRSAGERLAQDLLAADLKAVFVLSDGLCVNGSELVGGLNAKLPGGVVVTGGLAGDGPRFEKTWTIANGGPTPGQVVAVGFYGDRLQFGHGSHGGWDRFGPDRQVTRSEGNVLYELDGEPALALYKRYLGDHAADLPASGLLFPLLVRAPNGTDSALVRTILAVSEKDQSLTFAGDVPQGAKAQLMRANFDRLVNGAEEAAAMVESGGEAGAVLAIAISCVGRRLVLGERVEEEVEATLDMLPTAAVQTGFYSYGELSPWGLGRCELHNQTMTLTTLSERAR